MLTSTAEAAGAGPEAAPRVIGRYELLEPLGTGGMGVVYRARDGASARTVALKQLRSNTAGSKRAKLEALFEREYHTLVRLTHPRIIEVYDYGLSDSGPYYTMELLEGGDLQQLAPLPFREVCRHLADVASSLALIHAHRLVHRDISPRNVRFNGEGRAKLIDFGALTAFGPAADVVGTPSCTAPEVVRRMPLDQRTDLFALGAVAYFALTGRSAFPARRMDELPAAWARAVPPPSTFRPEIPAALDALVASLISIDPLARPAHAAHVIDQLCAIADLEVAETDLSAESYLASGRMVGREQETQWLQRRIQRALHAHGAEVVLEAHAGGGKTRLLNEVALDARLRGMIVLKTDAQASSGQFGVAIELALELLHSGGEVARAAAHAHATQLARLSPELRECFAESPLEVSMASPGEQRARMQTALHEWFLTVAKQEPILVAVDNLHAADDASVACLSGLGREANNARLLLLYTQRSGDRIMAPEAFRTLRTRSATLKLPALSANACEQLVESLFGDVAHSGRVAKLLYEKSAGNPQHCMDLAQLLVRKRIAKYTAGTWVLPLEVSSAELPGRVEELVQLKLASLTAGARALAETLCIHHKPVSIERCLSLVSELSEGVAHAALDQLLSEQILLFEAGRYRFVQEALRQTLEAGLSVPRARVLHRRAAEVALAGGDAADLESRMQGGFHLLRAGDETAGAELLASTSRAYVKTANAREDAQEVIAAMRAALDVYERHAYSPHERAALLFPLVMLTYYCPDFRLILHYAPRAIELGLEITGLGLAQKLRHVVGRLLALQIGLHIAGLRFERIRKQRGLDFSLPEAIASFSAIVPASIGAFGCCYDTDGAVRIGSAVEPLSLFGGDRLPWLMHAWSEGQVHLVHGLEADSRARFVQVLERFEDPAIRQALGEAHYKALRGGALFVLGLLTCYCENSKALEIVRDMDELGMRMWAMIGDQIRMLHHAFRGESEQVLHYRERVELFAVQGGTTWQTELFWPAVMINADALSGDTIAVRRTYEQLERRAQDVPSLRVHADNARAAYLSLRGDHAQAIALYERVVAELVPRRTIDWLPTRGHFARALNRAGEHARAKQLLRETFEHVTPRDRSVLSLCFEPRRQLALAEAGLGNHAEAIALLDAQLADYRADDNPMLLGLLHEACAQIALRTGDRDACQTELAQMEQYFRATGNSVLIARWKSVAEAATQAGLREAREAELAAITDSGVNSRLGVRTLNELSAAPNRGEYALGLVVQQARARGGCLYLMEQGRLRLEAASGDKEPPQELEQTLLREIERFQLESEANDADRTVLDLGMQSTEQASSLVWQDQSQNAAGDEGSVRPGIKGHLFLSSLTPPTPEGTHRVILLTSRRGVRDVAIGGVVLELDPRYGTRLDPEFLSAVADAVYPRDTSA